MAKAKARLFFYRHGNRTKMFDCPQVTISGQSNYETSNSLLALVCIVRYSYQHTQLIFLERGLILEAARI